MKLKFSTVAFGLMLLAFPLSLSASDPTKVAVKELTQEEAIRRAEFRLKLFLALSDLDTEGTDVTDKFLGLFGLNATLPDDLNGSIDLITPLEYADNMRRLFGDMPPLIDGELRESLTEVTWVQDGYFKVDLVFKKTLSVYYRNGQRMERYAEFHKITINVFEKERTEKITGIKMYSPGMPTEIAIEATPTYAIFGKRWSELDALESFGGKMDNQWDAGLSGRFRLHFNPLPPANITQRKSLRFTLGFDVAYLRSVAAEDLLVFESASPDVVLPGATGSSGIEGTLTSTVTDAIWRENTLWGSGLVGINLLLSRSGNRTFNLNVAAGVNYRLAGGVRETGRDSLAYSDLNGPGIDQANNDVDFIFDPSLAFGAPDDLTDQNYERTSSFSKGAGSGAWSTFLSINPNYAIRKNKWLQYSIGLDVRLPFVAAGAAEQSFPGNVEELEEVPWAEQFSKDFRNLQVGVTLGVAFGSKDKLK